MASKFYRNIKLFDDSRLEKVKAVENESRLKYIYQKFIATKIDMVNIRWNIETKRLRTEWNQGVGDGGGGRLNIKMLSYQYRDSHVKDKTVSGPSDL